jgi:peptide/nickel transport system ATP-binding protein
VSDVDLDIPRGRVTGVVGESGCGKSTLARLVLRLLDASSGSVHVDGTDLASLPPAGLRALRRRMQMVFQDPYSSIDPRYSVRDAVLEPLRVQGLARDEAANRAKVASLMAMVGLNPVLADTYPHQLSGGQKQRVGIARAFAGGAKIVVADEPVSALDVSVQAAVTDLLMEIQRKNRTTLLFISHDLSIVRYLSDRVMVMYLGHVVELGTTDQVFSPPYHPYTEALLSAVPIADTRVTKKRIVLEGDIPSAMNPPPGCPFQTRCRWKSQVPGNLCDTVMPPMRVLAGDHQIKCHLSDESLAGMEPVIKIAAE